MEKNKLKESDFHTASVAGISIMLGFALTIMQFWVFSPGPYENWDLFFIVPVSIAVLMQLYLLIVLLHPKLYKPELHSRRIVVFVAAILLVLVGTVIGGVAPDEKSTKKYTIIEKLDGKNANFLIVEEKKD